MADVVLSRIVSGVYPPGLRLPSEVDLAAELGCGRSTVREALQQLGGLGVVRSRRGSGALVLDFRRNGSPALLPTFLVSGPFDVAPLTMARELLRLRTFLACEAVRMAARYATPSTLEGAWARLAAAPALAADPVQHAANELELYRELVSASGIWPAVWLVNALWSPLGQVHEQLGPMLPPVSPEFQPTMQRLLDRIGDHDEAAAVAVASAWFESVDSELIDRLGSALAALRSGPSPRSNDR